MAVRRQKSLVLILAREFASQLAMPMFVADPEGNLVFYNEAAEQVLGRSFSEVGELSAHQWTEVFRPETLEGEPMTLQEMPAGAAFTERRPAHGTHRIIGLDGEARTVAVTAFPLLTQSSEPAGLVCLFWEPSEE
jgi:PAS domain S-box-containing protein